MWDEGSWRLLNRTKDGVRTMALLLPPTSQFLVFPANSNYFLVAI